MGGGDRRIIHNDIFNNIISLENIFSAWKEFKKEKSRKKDILEFQFNLEDNIFQLHKELRDKIYQHSDYTSFYINDPKLRYISKACVKDRALHQAIFRILYLIFDKSFIFDSYSSRINKGTHSAVSRLKIFCNKLSKNNNQNIFVLKCDIRKFFDSIDHNILLELIKRRMSDKNTIWLINQIVRSFEKEKNKGIPLGNVTSQLFANIYLNELDQFIKHKLKIKYYLRYADDFVILGYDNNHLIELIPKISNFLKNNLELKLHPHKVEIRKFSQGIDYLGYIILPHHKTLRTKTKKRMFKKIKVKKEELNSNLITQEKFDASLNSYLGILKHCDGYKVKLKLETDSSLLKILKVTQNDNLKGN